MSRSRPVTPFIPPPPGASPQSSASDGPPPLVPAPGGAYPPWMQTPYAVPGMFPATGQVPGGSGFIPPGPPPLGRPGGGAQSRPHSRGDRHGFSEDWIGPTGPNGAGLPAGFPQEWLAPQGWATPGPVAAHPSPWGAGVAGVPTGFSPFPQQIQGVGYIPMGPPIMPGVAPPGYGLQVQIPAQATPWMGGGFAMTPGPPPHPPLGGGAEDLARPVVEAGNVDTRFMVGRNYGPTLEPLLVAAVRCQPIMNPLLSPPPGSIPGDDSNRTHLIWNMLFDSSFAKHSDDASSSRHANRSWTKGRDEPATFPRLTSLKIVSHQLPWFIEITASGYHSSRRSRHRRSRSRSQPVDESDEEGANAPFVTCGDVIDQLSEFLLGTSPENEYHSLDKRRKDAIGRTYYENRSAGHDVPGGRLGQGLARCDWLGINTMWDGLTVDTAYVRERLGLKASGERGRDMPCVFVLKCEKRGGGIHEDDDEGAARES